MLDIKALPDKYETLFDTLEDIIAMGGNIEAAGKAPHLNAHMTQFDMFLGVKVCLHLSLFAEGV